MSCFFKIAVLSVTAAFTVLNAGQKVLDAAILPDASIIYTLNQKSFNQLPSAAKWKQISEKGSKSEQSPKLLGSDEYGMTSIISSIADCKDELGFDPSADMENMVTSLAFTELNMEDFQNSIIRDTRFCTGCVLSKSLDPDKFFAVIDKTMKQKQVDCKTTLTELKGIRCINIEFSRNGENTIYVIAFVDENKGLLSARINDIEDTLARFAATDGNTSSNPELTAAVNAIDKDAFMGVSICLPDSLKASIKKQAAEPEAGMQGLVMLQLAQLKGINFQASPAANDGFKLALGFLTPSQDAALQFKAMLLDGFVMPMLPVIVAGKTNIQLDAMSNLKTSINNSKAVLETVLTSADLDLLMTKFAE